MGAAELTPFLSSLAVDRNVAATFRHSFGRRPESRRPVAEFLLGSETREQIAQNSAYSWN